MTPVYSKEQAARGARAEAEAAEDANYHEFVEPLEKLAVEIEGMTERTRVCAIGFNDWAPVFKTFVVQP